MRTFGQPLSAFQDVLAAVGSFTARAAEKLRRQGDATHLMTVFPSKSHSGLEPPYSCSVVLTLRVGISDTTELVHVARMALKRLWQPNSRYTKAGVVLAGLEPAGQTQLSLFERPPRPLNGTSL